MGFLLVVHAAGAGANVPGNELEYGKVGGIGSGVVVFVGERHVD